MINHDSLFAMLSAKAPPLEVAKWLRSNFLPYLIARFNQDECRKRLGLYQGEQIPQNERNLTDVRNRVSLIIEYELARIANDVLTESGISELFWSYVVANRFPDLEVRQTDGTRRLRIEVKCLQSISEEKSANFDTLKKDLNPSTDYVVVFVWEWGYNDSRTYAWDRAPQLLKCYVFNATALAELRDAYWLNRPPEDLGNGYQGFDLRYAVNCKEGTYAEEEGNYGKLLRIWQPEFEFRPRMTPVLKDTESEYIIFRQEVILLGFWSLTNYYLPIVAQIHDQPVKQLKDPEISGGASLGEFGFFIGSASSLTRISEIMQQEQLRFGITMSEKYVCSGLVFDGISIKRVFSGVKPKNLSSQLFRPFLD